MNKANTKTKDEYIIMQKKNEIRGGPLLYIIGICRGGGSSISIIIYHHDSVDIMVVVGGINLHV
jgi:hypothetical protein